MSSPAVADRLEVGIVVLKPDGELLLQRIAPVDLPGGAYRAGAGELPALDGLRPARERLHS